MESSPSRPEKSLKPYYLRIRDDLIKLIPHGAKRVLDVGCGGGMTGKVLLEKGVEFVAGIEKFEDAANYASRYYSHVILGDVEKIELPFPDGFFDCILYGDVLEHLLDPWSVLEKHRRLLRQGGTVIVSIPNVRYYKIIKELVFRGDWRYADDGILDRTHIRFFTLTTVVEMLEAAGFKVVKVVKKPSGAKWLKLLNTILRNSLIDFLVRQYLILAVKKDRD